MSYSLCLLEPAIHRLCHHLLVRLFSVCAVVPIFITFGGVSESQDTYHGFLYFLTFLVFLSGFFILLVREKHRKTLYRFLLAKIKGWDRNNRDKNSEHDNNNKNKWQTK